MLRDGCFEQVDSTDFMVTDKGLSSGCVIEDLHNGASLTVTPAIWPRDPDGDTGIPGVRLYVNDWDHFGDATLENFNAWVRFLDRFDLFQTSQAAAQVAAARRAQPVVSTSTSAQPVRRSRA
jgi:hypothetical protein